MILSNTNFSLNGKTLSLQLAENRLNYGNKIL